MEAMAEPGSAYLTQYTARLVQGWFTLDELGVRPVKGTTDPIRVSRLGPPMSSPFRRAVGMAPLVGREREFTALEEALAIAMDGQAQVVGVVGEAGVGKSRLCQEFAASCRARGITVRRAVGVSHAREIPLLPILAFHREYFGIVDGDEPATARRKVSERLLDLDARLEDTLPLMFDFLEVPDPDRPVPRMAPDVRMRRIFDAVRRITAQRSERETLVLIFEDLHWFDPHSEVFLERLIESYPGSRTLVVTNFRPEFTPGWVRHSYYRQLPLAPLPAQAVGEMLGGLLGVDLSLAPLVSFVLERTGGNPFFVEEVVRAFIEEGTLVGGPGNYRLTRPLDDLQVPPSVQAVLAARIDRLPPEQKVLIQTASVIGRTFDATVLVAISDLEADDLEKALSGLCAAELLQRDEGRDGEQHRFWHALTQDVAYKSLLGDRRRRLHAAVGQALASQRPDRVDELAAVLAWHWEQAGRSLEAAGWNLRAGTWALRSDLAEAERRWRAAVELAGTADESDEAGEIGFWALARLLQFRSRTGMDPDEAERLYRDTQTAAARLANPKLTAWFLAVSGSRKTWAGDLRAGLESYLEGARLAESTGDPDLQAATWVAPAMPLMYTGPLEEGLRWAGSVLRICAGDPERGVGYLGYSPLSRIRSWRACLIARTGRLVEASLENQQAIALARSRGDSEMLAWALSVVAEVAWLTGEDLPSPEAALEALQIGQDTANVGCIVLALEGLALSHLPTNPIDAIGACQRGLETARKRRSGLFAEGSLLCHLARAHLATGNVAAALVAAEEAVEVSRAQGAAVMECLALLTGAQAKRIAGEGEPAQDLEAAEILVHQTNALAYEPILHEELGRLHDDDKELEEALRLYRQIGATGHARRLEAEPLTRATP
jgi:adenylate cyclase